MSVTTSTQHEVEAVIKDANGNVIPDAKFNVASSSFGKMEIKPIVESSGNSSSTTVNFSLVNITLTVSVNN